MEVLMLFGYWTLWLSKRHTVTLHHVSAMYNGMFDHVDGMMPALAKKKTPWKEDLFFALKLAQLKVYKHSAERTTRTSMLLCSAHILEHFQKLQLFR
jgi:hypothetical protein